MRYQALIEKLNTLAVDCAENVPMRQHTTFRIGGAARLIAQAADDEQLRQILLLCKEHALPHFILGNGSNLCVKDTGLDCVVLSTNGLQNKDVSDDNRISCGAGLRLSELCGFALRHSLTGLEFAYGIPGTVGGAVFMNAGAYGGEMKDIVESVRFLDETLSWCELPANALHFSYRHSVFAQNHGIITNVTLRLRRGDTEKIKAAMDDVMLRRKTKQPLDMPSAGSVFKRPEGQFAGALIEQCGLKGKQIGGARVSEKHAGFIVNTGGASAADVRALIALIQQVVAHETGFFLIPEILFV
ncbi:MAG: UDP-N-acetylmuramate dehydrogenase [Oscillospiraceae bacterium]|nr:UDP-N-acetylmuramate dehydrogenase [Oscillospiraceae bacterium]